MKQALLLPNSEPNPERSVATGDDQGSEARQTFLNFRSKTTTFAHLKNEVNRT